MPTGPTEIGGMFDITEIIDEIPETDLETLLEGLQDGAECVADVYGFDDEALSAIEEMALGYYRSRRYEQAATIYGLVLQMNVKRSNAWRGLAACAHAQKSYLVAMRCYQSAVHWNPEDIVSKVYAGECMCMAGDTEGGVAALEEVVDSNVTDIAMLPYITRARAIIGANGGVPPKVVLIK